MLTRLQAKRVGEAVAAENKAEVKKRSKEQVPDGQRRFSARCAAAAQQRSPLPVTQRPLSPKPPAEETSILALSDLSLQHVFRYMRHDELVLVAQVCRRWRELCESRRLWSGLDVRFTSLSGQQHDAMCVALVRTLRRAHGVASYSGLELELKVDYVEWFLPPTHQSRVYFRKNADRLVVTTSSSFMALLCLRELLKPAVSLLKLTDMRWQTYDVSTFEAFCIWEAIASKRCLLEIKLYMWSNNALFSSPFRWEKAGSVHTVRLNLRYNGSSGKNGLCLPVRSLLRAHSSKLVTVHVTPEDQQALLAECPATLLNLRACLLPGLLPVLEKMHSLRYVHLQSPESDKAKAENSRQVLRAVLDMPHLQRSVFQLYVSVTPDQRLAVPTVQGSVVAVSPTDEMLLTALSKFQHLKWVRLQGMCKVLEDPACGTRLLRELLAGLPVVKTLSLYVAPCALSLGALVTAAGEGGGAGGCVPETLRHLWLRGLCHFPETVPYRCCDRTAWMTALQRLLNQARWLHVSVEHGRCVAPPRLPTKLIILPHATDDYCQDCPIKEGYKGVYISDFCK